jgi:hypothetical protein
LHFAPFYQEHFIVIPAKAGIHRSDIEAVEKWIPAFAGMT